MIRVMVAVITLMLAGCAGPTTRMVGDTEVLRDGSCHVTVYQTKSAAVEAGLKREICVVEGTSQFSFDHTIQGAIRKNIKGICGCGANKAYVASAHSESQLGVRNLSHVSLVGFE